MHLNCVSCSEAETLQTLLHTVYCNIITVCAAANVENAEMQIYRWICTKIIAVIECEISQIARDMQVQLIWLWNSFLCVRDDRCVLRVKSINLWYRAYTVCVFKSLMSVHVLAVRRIGWSVKLVCKGRLHKIWENWTPLVVRFLSDFCPIWPYAIFFSLADIRNCIQNWIHTYGCLFRLKH